MTYPLRTGADGQDDDAYAKMCNESYAQDLVVMNKCVERASAIWATHLNHMGDSLQQTVESLGLSPRQAEDMEQFVFLDCFKVALIENQAQQQQQSQQNQGQQQQQQQSSAEVQYILKQNIIPELETKFAEFAKSVLDNIQSIKRNTVELCPAEYVEYVSDSDSNMDQQQETQQQGDNDDDDDNEENNDDDQDDDEEADGTNENTNEEATVAAAQQPNHHEPQVGQKRKFDTSIAAADSPTKSNSNTKSEIYDCDCLYCEAVMNVDERWAFYTPTTVFQQVVFDALKQFYPKK